MHSVSRFPDPNKILGFDKTEKWLWNDPLGNSLKMQVIMTNLQKIFQNFNDSTMKKFPSTLRKSNVH